MTEPLTVTVALYQLDHLSARFRHELPGVGVTPPGVEFFTGVDHARVGIDLPLREWTTLGRPGTVTLTIQPGTVPPASADRPHKVGDPDPTPNLGVGGYCGARDHGGPICTWQQNHSGPHVAGDGQIVVATWEQ